MLVIARGYQTQLFKTQTKEGFAHVLAAHPQVRHQFLQHPGASARKLPWMACELE
jgi:hypothetical protein